MSDLAEICTRGIIQGEENSVSKIFGKCKFLRKLHATKVRTFQFLPNVDPIYSMKEVEIEKTKYCRGQNLAIGLSKYRKIKALSPLNFQEKYDYILLYFGYFLPKGGAWSHVKGSESKFDYPIAVSQFLGMFPCKKFVAALPSFAAITIKGRFF